jgi:enoyl-[acyl-carrier-protein] reductase (NADH)
MLATRFAGDRFGRHSRGARGAAHRPAAPPGSPVRMSASTAEAVAFLASDRAAYITGEILNVSSGA